ncbi:Suppressor of Sensor Kinase (SLN1) [Apophysomyces sp. BC1034]|nr:Suppressor of Sensor Kinase (SLN1) [Apophysomyces sp. BC1015]KAG0182147.1 Suppressor of Sensor Kinase (SLN1) [Apophysomyces sp. BC1021]KAG0192804.1 Suppressor of Sensor Kinase (SLN1) [Apophysomyces sp. BC1034]
MEGVRRVRWTELNRNFDNTDCKHSGDFPLENEFNLQGYKAVHPSNSQDGHLEKPAQYDKATGPNWSFALAEDFSLGGLAVSIDEEYEDSDGDDSNNNAAEDEDETALNQLYAQNYALLTAPPEIAHERLEWQQMLQSVLMGEVIKSEKKRLMSTDQFKLPNPIQEIWLSLRALLRGRTIGSELKCLEESRRDIDSVLDMVMEFKVDEGSKDPALMQVAETLKSVDRIESLYPTRADMINAHPKYGSYEFQHRLDALNAWCTTTRSLHMQYKILRDWTGSENLQIARKQTLAEYDSAQTMPSFASTHQSDPSFLERILKESALQDTFDKRTLSALNSLLLKSKQTMVDNVGLFQQLRLPPYISQLRKLACFPTSLVVEAMKLRLEYTNRLNEPPKQILDAMLEDYRGLIALACRVKQQHDELVDSAPGWDFEDDQAVSQNYDNVLMESMLFYFSLISWKLTLEKDNTLRVCEVMEKEWEFLHGSVCRTVDKAFGQCAEFFCSLTNIQLADVMDDYVSSLQAPIDNSGVETTCTKILHTMRMRARQFENAAEYLLNDDGLQFFVDCLADTGHFLVYTGAFEDEQTYVMASPSLYGREDTIQMLIRSRNKLGHEPVETPGSSGPGMTGRQNTDYVLFLTPWQNMLWTGHSVNIPVPSVNARIKTGRVRLITRNSKLLLSAKSCFWEAVKHTGIHIIQDHKAHIPKMNKELSKIKKTVFKLAEATIASVNTIREQTTNLGCQELVEECFSFASDFGMRSAKMLKMKIRHQLDLKLIRLAISWICFVTDECIPTDRKTFRWAVAALEFGHSMTRGVSVLALDEAEFTMLQSKVARCIALLISHFDVLGTRWAHDLQLKEKEERMRGITAKRNSYMTGKRMDKHSITTSSTFGSENDTVSSSGGVTYIRDAWMRKISELEDKRNTSEQECKLVGKVLDDQKPEDKSLMFLAPSSSNISFRWQQGRFIGAGTFGSVYLAINLDTSTVMAVKEIRFPDSSSLSALHKSIKEEMKVMQMLHHDNIVQYYGMEVHRDKVFIFMEYCENGSLGTLLDNGGRIEDELYIVSYAHQLLSGLAYLHNNNIVHRDIKPDNILIDYQGQLKLTDFGASKILAKGQRTTGKTTLNMNANSLAGTPMYMAPEVITGGDTGRKGSMDIWSLGCCIVQMATGRRPWSTLENEWSVMYHVVTGHPPLPDSNQLSRLGINFLKKCFIRNPRKRPTAEELLSHAWIKKYLENMNENMNLDLIAAAQPPDCRDNSNGTVSSINTFPMRTYEEPLARSITDSMAVSGALDGRRTTAETQSYFQMVAQNTSSGRRSSTQSDTKSLARSLNEEEISYSLSSV